MVSLTASFFLVEIIVGYITNSIALVADSFHMLSDVVSLIVAFAAVRIAKWSTSKNTFGWARAEVLGALVNAVFLLALCFSILVESLKRLVEPEKIEDPKLLLIVGAVGLLVNVLGLFLFGSHGHSHGGGAHSHGAEAEALVAENPPPHRTSEGSIVVEIEEGHHGHSHTKGGKAASGSQLNMRGAFLHILGDALGSVVVIISALVIWFAKGDWKYYVDPGMSIAMVIIILCTTIPLLKESSYILLQAVPNHIQVQDLEGKLHKIEGVLAVHEFHIWALAGNRIIASAHIRCRNLHEYMILADKIKEMFHHEGIHSTTIQPEFVEVEEAQLGRDCMLECGPDRQCYPNTCCGKKISSVSNGKTPSDSSVLTQKTSVKSLQQTESQEAVKKESDEVELKQL
ncbi:proton-coupled zinc antiporter SLC30A1-like [Liolophura sinensis]|uniref:proton-coupled zinc antiporter SLC30A1-like n=1 Tax=Liolophura sinensis TaxID=3198878 RepID=UPI0031581726